MDRVCAEPPWAHICQWPARMASLCRSRRHLTLGRAIARARCCTSLPGRLEGNDGLGPCIAEIALEGIAGSRDWPVGLASGGFERPGLGGTIS